MAARWGRRPAVSSAGSAWKLAGGVVIGGLLSGSAVALLAFLVARYGPAADGWSFRGNGALAVYPLVLPALAGGWTWLARHRVPGRGWLLPAGGAVIVGAALVGLSAAALPLFGNGPLTGPVTLLGLGGAFVWAFGAPTWAWAARRAGAPVGAILLPACGGWALAVAAGVVVTGIIVPAGS